MRTRVIIADDHTIIREGLKNLLELKGVDVVAIASNGREAVALTLAHKPDIVMMDIAMPDLNGVEAAAAIHKKLPRIKIIALSMHSNKKIIDNMFASGACGYVLKDCALDEIYIAIQEVKKGNFYLTPEIERMYALEKDFDFHNLKLAATLRQISSKERQVVQLVAEGVKTRDIAQRLNISHKTVESHRQNIMKKLNIFTIAGLTKFAIKEGICSLE